MLSLVPGEPGSVRQCQDEGMRWGAVGPQTESILFALPPQGSFWKSPRWKHPGSDRRQRSWSRTMSCSNHLAPLTTWLNSQVPQAA